MHTEVGNALYFALRHVWEGHWELAEFGVNESQANAKIWAADHFNHRLPDDWKIGLLLLTLSDKEIADALETASTSRHVLLEKSKSKDGVA